MSIVCGIAGFFISDTVDPNQIGRNMLSAIRYRGRDGEATYTAPGGIHLCHSRLAVLDLKTGSQPMADASNRFVIIHNGEIYNYLELRTQYEAMGARFRTRSDTEVILEGFRLKGAAVCADLNGMFAFAIWDSRERRLFLARDRMGKKTLFWTVINGCLYFASTLAAFAGIPGWTGKIEPKALEMQITFGTLGLRQTVYKQAEALPPASHAWVTPKSPEPKITRYWEPRFLPKIRLSEEDALDCYEELLTDAIKIRLRADVPIALTFSGGVASGTIAALAARKLNRALACFCIDYHTDDDPSEETEIARRTAEHLGLELTPLFFDYHTELLPQLAQAYQYYDQPITQLPIVYNLALFSRIKPFATVVLGGNGGDELFAGYNGNEAQLKRDKAAPLQRLPVWLRRLLPERFCNRTGIVKDFPVWAAGLYRDASPVRQAFADELYELFSVCGVNSHMDLLMFSGLYTSSADGNYRIPDISGMQAQVEVRSPFLDYRLVEFAATLPHWLKVRNPEGSEGNKWLPKRLYERYVPRDIAWASKKGMGWNINFDHAFVLDPNYTHAFEGAMAGYESAGLPTDVYRQAFEQYQVEKRKDMMGAPHCGNIMAAAFMQGTWLHQSGQG